jgi:16S rRNA (cytosine967-C5)-methyltransferase
LNERKPRRSGDGKPGEATSARRRARDILHDTVDRAHPVPDGPGPGLSPADDAFSRRLARTAIRHIGEIDHYIGQLMERPLPVKEGRTRNALRIGLCELVFMETADHAATDEAVRLANPRHAGLVNAVLRNFVRRRAELSPPAASVNLPGWLFAAWSKALGETEAEAAVAALKSDPPLDLTCRADAESWAERLGGVFLAPSTVRLTGGAVSVLEGYDEGAWWVQDHAASLPARLLGDIRGKSVLDLCAAPGGKTSQLAASGADVVALDRSEKRLERLTENMKRLGLEVRTVAADAAEWHPEVPADAVLLDAPCSATGTLRRHPDVAWTKRQDDIVKLSALQARLLPAAADMVKPDGVLVYCVCSLQPEEGVEVIDGFLAAHPEWRIDPVRPEEVPSAESAITPRGELRTLPQHLAGQGGIDGFYAVRLTRA